MNNKKTATNRKGMIPNRLNKFSIRKYSVGTASILVGTTLIFGLSGHEAKAAEHTNGELNQSKMKRQFQLRIKQLKKLIAVNKIILNKVQRQTNQK